MSCSSSTTCAGYGRAIRRGTRELHEVLSFPAVASQEPESAVEPRRFGVDERLEGGGQALDPRRVRGSRMQGGCDLIHLLLEPPAR